MAKIDFGIKGLIINDGKFLAVHKAGIQDDKYELPGGRMIFGESIEDTLIREIHEELNLMVKPVKLVDTWTYINADANYQVAGVIYFCHAQNLDDIRLSEEHTDFQWFDFTDSHRMNTLFDKQIARVKWDELILLNHSTI